MVATGQSCTLEPGHWVLIKLQWSLEWNLNLMWSHCNEYTCITGRGWRGWFWNICNWSREHLPRQVKRKSLLRFQFCKMELTRKGWSGSFCWRKRPISLGQPKIIEKFQAGYLYTVCLNAWLKGTFCELRLCMEKILIPKIFLIKILIENISWISTGTLV